MIVTLINNNRLCLWLKSLFFDGEQHKGWRWIIHNKCIIYDKIHYAVLYYKIKYLNNSIVYYNHKLVHFVCVDDQPPERKRILDCLEDIIAGNI